MTNINTRTAALALGLSVTTLSLPSLARGSELHISAHRAAAIHECSVRASQYSEQDWGNTEIYVYGACMADHGEEE